MTARTVRFALAPDPAKLRNGDGKLLWSCAAAAIAMVGTAPQAAKAQTAPAGAFRGTIIGEPANVSRGSLTPTSETITVTASKATIDWSASQQDFLPAGNVATFLGSGVSDFTVLNRISASGPIELNGTVLGRLQGQAANPAGNIWFYAPGGILVGATALFDVGSLVLTTLNPTDFDQTADGFGNFALQAQSPGTITVAAGAQINALNPGSYVAMIAPRVVQGGTVQVNGSAAFVAGENLTMTMNQGLFDIAVGVGTDDANGIVHSGSTGGPANPTAFDNHHIYMVAVPKNQALTMLLGGSMGFAPAVSAEVENGHIVLSSGGGLGMGTGNYSSALRASAVGDITVADNAVASDLDLNAGGSIMAGNLTANGEVDLEAEGNILFGNATAEDFEFDAGGSVTGGDITASLQVGGEAEGAVVLGDINVGPGLPIDDPENDAADFSVGIGSATSITVGNVTGAGNVGFATLGDFTSGNLSAGDLVLLMVGGDIATGAITTAEAGRVYLADASMFIIGGGGGEDCDCEDGDDADFDPDIVLALDPIPTGGSITVDGAVTTGLLQATAGGGFTSGDLSTSGAIKVSAGAAIAINEINSGGDVELSTPATITTGDIDADGFFTALAHGNMSFGDVVAEAIYLADFVTTAPGSGALVGTCVGNCGILGPDGVVTAPPGGTSYTYVTTTNGVSGAGQLPGVGGTNGSAYTTSPFGAAAGDELIFGFNYVTSDGSGFADYAWAALYTATLDPVAILFTARTQPSGTIVPGQNLPGVEATLNPSSVPIISGGPQWTPLGSDSGSCYGPGCGYTGWVSSTYEIADAGNYVLLFGVSNWSDTGLQTGMAFSGITVGGVPVEGGPIRTGGSISIGDVKTGSFTAAAGTALTAGNIDSSGGISIDAGGAILTSNLLSGGPGIAGAGGGITIQSETDGPSIEISSDTSVATGNIDSAENVLIGSDGWIETGDIDAVGDIDLEAAGTITTADTTAGGGVDFDADGNIEIGNTTAGDSISLLSGGTIATADTTAGGGVEFDADGNIELGNATAGDSISLHSGGTLTAGNMDAATDVVVVAGSDVSVADVLAGGSIDLTAGGLAEFLGLVSAPQITVTSGDITIADGASLGEAGVTEVLNLIAVSDSPVLIGSGADGDAGQYTLDEDGDIVAETVNVTAEADVIVHNVEIEGSQTSGGGVAHVNLTSDGNVVVTGVVDYVNVGETDTLAITAGGSIQVDTDAGGISMTDSDGDLAGMLELTAHDIWVADADLLEQLNANPNFTGRDDALAVNAGQVVPDGYIRAGGVTATMLGSSFFVQNSGTANSPAGISVGQGGLTIINEGTEPAAVTIFGKQFNPDGTAVSGDDFFDEVEFAGASGFAAGSTVNGCEVGGVCTPDAPPFDAGAESILGPVGLMSGPIGEMAALGGLADSESGEDSEEESAESVAAALGLISTGGLSAEQLVDDPVTSGSDSGQWGDNLEIDPGE